MDPKLQQLLAAMGCASPEDALAQVARINTLLASLQAATGKPGQTEAIDAANGAVAFAKQLEAALGCTGSAALAKIEGLQESAGKVEALEKRAQTAEKQAADRDAKEAIDAATADGRVSPANRDKAESMYAKFGLEGLQTYLDTLPKSAVAPSNGAPKGPQPMPTNGQRTPGSLSAEEKQLAKALGRNEKDLAESLNHWEQNGGTLSTVDMCTMNRAAPRTSRGVSTAAATPEAAG